MAVAVRDGDRWRLHLPEQVEDVTTLFSRLRARSPADQPSIFIGFDFPIGLPRAYGALTGLSNFTEALRCFGKGDWKDWFSSSEDRTDISVFRPFYPFRPGGRKKEHVLTGLGLSSGQDLLRLCERKTDKRQAACSLFWTLGGNQVGKGAASGWRDVLIPNIDSIALWPFDGPLTSLLETREIVVAETYPGDVYGQLGIARKPVWSKRKQEGRASVARPLLEWLESRPVHSTEGLAAAISSGFSARPDGEDQFDAVVGLFGMLDVLQGKIPDTFPIDRDINRWEGWILGQAPTTG